MLHALLALSVRGCTYLPNTDWDTTWGDTVKASSKEACCAACMKEAKCLAATLSGDECYLKGGVIKAKTKQGVTGCVARAPPKPSPPFDCSAPDARCAERIGSTHWNPCYAVNQTIPSLLDGAAAVASMGSKTLKLALFSPKGNYPWNSPAWPEDKSFKTMLEVAQHPYYRTLWQMPEITTYVLIAYSTVGGAAGGDISYWTKGITEAQVAEETSQFLACAQFLLEEYGAEGKTFVFENWEGDWASRAGGYDPSTPATPLALASMTRWLEGRQIGVSLAREAYEARAARAGTEANGKVFFSAEVNLVQDSRMTGAPNMVNRVLPFVSTDMVSYSSYDSMESPVDLKACLEFIAKNHNRTVASPKGNEAIFVAEYGYAQNHVPNTTLVSTVENVVNTALEWGAGYVIFWETMDNECTGGTGCSNAGTGRSRHRTVGAANGAGRCYGPTQVRETKNLNGFWLVKPDGSTSWPFKFFTSKIAESSS